MNRRRRDGLIGGSVPQVRTLFGQQGGGALTVDNTDYTLGLEFRMSLPGSLLAVWFFSPAGAASLPSRIALFTVAGQVDVHDEAAAWSAAAGSGWVRAPFAAAPALASGTAYVGCVLDNAGDSFYGAIANYWSSGPGAGGVSNGPLSAPNNAGATGGQERFTIGLALAYPASSNLASWYGIDVEVLV